MHPKTVSIMQSVGNRAGSEESALNPLQDMIIAFMVPQHLILKENLPGRQRRIKDIGWLAEVPMPSSH